MNYLLLIHLIFTICVLIDGHKLKLNIIPWAIGTIILGPIILPLYISKRHVKGKELREVFKWQKLFTGLALFWAILLALIGIWGRNTPIDILKEESLEYRLAVINTGGHNSEKDDTIGRFRSLLSQLSDNYIEDTQQIANMSVIVRDRLSSNGIDESLLNIMEGLNQILWPQDSPKKRYSEYAFTYAGLRNKGLSHQEAIETLQSVASGY
ncbi:MAG: hypothetical protein ACMUIU_11960 [bacterium]